MSTNNTTKGIKALFFTFMLFCFSPVFGQNKYLTTKKADRLVEKSDYSKATSLYLSVLNVDEKYYMSNSGLVNIYLNKLQKIDSAKYFLKKCIDYPLKDTNYIDYFEYAHCLHLLNKPVEALKYYKKFEALYKFENNKQDIALKNELAYNKAACSKNSALLNTKSDEIFVTNMGKDINSKESEYTSIFVENEKAIIYNGRHKDYNKEKTFVDDQYFENVYFYKLDNEKGKLGRVTQKQKTHYAIVNKVGNSDSLIVYFENKLWISTLKNKEIDEKIALPAILSNYYHQPSGIFTKDQNTFIFSARKTKKDNLDFYTSTKDENGNWSAPNKIKELNTNLDEDGLFLADNDNTLYFSSKGFNSSGGYDIYKTTKKDGKWTTPINMNYPINSPRDDIFYEFDSKGNGFLSSNRVEGYGLMDIYKVQLPPTPVFNCDSFPNKELTATFDIDENQQIKNLGLDYEWIFDDTQVLNGTSVTKTFNFPGEHFVNINITEKTSGIKEQNEIHKTIIIDSVNYVGYSYPNYLIVDSVSTFNANVSYIDNQKIMAYFWRVNDSIIEGNKNDLEYIFKNKGTQKIDLQINTLNKDNQYSSYCYTKTFKTILSSDLNTPNNTSDENGHISKDSVNTLLAENTLVNDLDFKPIIYFGFDKSFITKKASVKLNNLISYLEANPTAKIVISGHTDAMGDNFYNKKLAERRIKSTIKYLNKHGLNNNRIQKTIAYGEEKPAESNTLPNGKDNFIGRKLNRRVEFIIYK